MILVADIGNTNITLGVFEGDRLLSRRRLLTRPERSAAAYGRELRAFWARAHRPRRPTAFVYGSVVPRLDRTFHDVARRCFGLKARAISVRSRLGMRVRVDHPGQVGADRLLNALAVRKLYGAPAVVIDFGTATTLDCVSKEGDFIGGAILIGPRIAAQALTEKTAKLPKVTLRAPRRFIGKNTVDCMRVGLHHGYVGMVRHVLEGTLKEMGRGKTKVVATGGLAGLFAAELPLDAVAPDLTLQGLRLAYETIS